MLPATINRIYSLITNDHLFILSLLQAIFDSSLGALTCIIFLLSPEIKHSLISCFKKIRNVISSCFRKINDESSTNQNLSDSVKKAFSESYISENSVIDDMYNYKCYVDQSKRTSII